MPDTTNAKDCLELPPTNFSIFTLKERDLTNLCDYFHSTAYCFLFRFVWFTLIKKLMQTSIVIVSGSIINASTVHLNGIWHLIWRYISKPVLGGHYSIPRGCPLNTGFTVLQYWSYYVKMNSAHRRPKLITWTRTWLLLASGVVLQTVIYKGLYGM